MDEDFNTATHKQLKKQTLDPGPMCCASFAPKGDRELLIYAPRGIRSTMKLSCSVRSCWATHRPQSAPRKRDRDHLVLSFRRAFIRLSRFLFQRLDHLPLLGRIGVQILLEGCRIGEILRRLRCPLRCRGTSYHHAQRPRRRRRVSRRCLSAYRAAPCRRNCRD